MESSNRKFDYIPARMSLIHKILDGNNLNPLLELESSETDAFINTTVIGGVGPYEYLWSNDEISENLNGIGAGSYTVTVTDANGCICFRFTSL